MSRDDEILGYLEEFGYLRAPDAAALFCRGKRQALTIARRRLRALWRQGLCQRFAEGPRGQFVYTTRGRSQKWRHSLAVVRVHVALATSPAVRRVYVEPEYVREAPGLSFRSDGLVILETDTGTALSWLEIDRGTERGDGPAGRPWERYEDYAGSRAFSGESWFRSFGTFPRVVVVGSPRRLEALRRRAEASPRRVRLLWCSWPDIDAGRVQPFLPAGMATQKVGD